MLIDEGAQLNGELEKAIKGYPAFRCKQVRGFSVWHYGGATVFNKWGRLHRGGDDYTGL